MPFCLLCLSLPQVSAENFIGFDGQAHKYPTNSDGLHVLNRRVHRPHLRHMMNQKPTIVSQHNLHTSRPVTSSKSTVVLASKAMRQPDKAFINDGVHGLTTSPSYNVRFDAGSKQEHTGTAVFSPAAASVASGLTVGSTPGPAPAMAPASAPSNNAWNMDEDMGAAEQGFSGDIVEHDNGKTMTKDWRNEYGKHADGLHSYVEICALYPDNSWCRNNGYHTPAPRSSAVQAAGGTVLSLVFAAAALLA